MYSSHRYSKPCALYVTYKYNSLISTRGIHKPERAGFAYAHLWLSLLELNISPLNTTQLKMDEMRQEWDLSPTQKNNRFNPNRAGCYNFICAPHPLPRCSEGGA